eukprot:gene21163-41136_t
MIPVMPSSKLTTVLSAKLLNPLISNDFNLTLSLFSTCEHKGRLIETIFVLCSPLFSPLPMILATTSECIESAAAWQPKGIRLLIVLSSLSYDIACAIDLDTILPVWVATWFRSKKRVYDAHEYFTEMKEVRTRPRVRAVWKWIERTAVPHFKQGYTVNQHLADLFLDQLKIKLEVVRNLPSLQNQPDTSHKKTTQK